MASTYSVGGSRRVAVFVAIIILHLIFFWALKQGLVRAGLELVQDYAIMDLPPPPPPPEDLDEPPPPPPGRPPSRGASAADRASGLRGSVERDLRPGEGNAACPAAAGAPGTDHA